MLSKIFYFLLGVFASKFLDDNLDFSVSNIKRQTKVFIKNTKELWSLLYLWFYFKLYQAGLVKLPDKVAFALGFIAFIWIITLALEAYNEQEKKKINN